jgi:Protein of unknown function (DUF4038)
LDDPTWAPLIDLSAAYTYFPTYVQILKEYNRPNFKPVFMVEANYEFEKIPNTDGGSIQNLRRQEYWTMLSGATGQVYGSAYTWRLPKDWETNLDTLGIVQFAYMKALFCSPKMVRPRSGPGSCRRNGRLRLNINLILNSPRRCRKAAVIRFPALLVTGQKIWSVSRVSLGK